jgi:hypothetical protein
MAAGGFKEFVAGETLDEDEINDFLMQGMLVFAGTAARGSAITSPVEGQFCFLKDSDTVELVFGAQYGGSGGARGASGLFVSRSGLVGQGFGGGAPSGSNSGGGGGASAVGGNAGANGGTGGAGVASSITGSSVTRAGGGGGGAQTGSAGAGGTGGGGAGAVPSNNGTDGGTNLGGGGGGAASGSLTYRNGGNGGSGVVIFSVPTGTSVSFSAGVTETNSTVGDKDVSLSALA